MQVGWQGGGGVTWCRWGGRAVDGVVKVEMSGMDF